MTAVDEAWLENESSGVRVKIRWPIVLTMRHPPSAVPIVRRRRWRPLAHSGTDMVSLWPEASKSTAITPIDFCASLPP